MISEHAEESSNVQQGKSHHALHDDFRFSARYPREEFAYIEGNHEEPTQHVNEGEEIELPWASSIEVD